MRATALVFFFLAEVAQAQTITSVTPDWIVPTGDDVTLLVIGTGFVDGPDWDGAGLAAVTVDSEHSYAGLFDSYISCPTCVGVHELTIGDSAPYPVTIYLPLAGDFLADVEFGQQDFTSTAGAVVDTAETAPGGIAIDPNSGRVFVADPGENRVLSWPSTPLQNAAAADLVFGQPDADTRTANSGGLSASSMSEPWGVAIDAAGDLLVADSGNNRVLIFSPPFASAMAASAVIGQADFTHSAANRGGSPASNSLSMPTSLAVDSQGTIYVADWQNNRVLAFAAASSAAAVIGQTTTSGNAPNITNTVTPSQSSLFGPFSVAVDASDNLWVADSDNNRVLQFTVPIATSGASAALQIGQADFTHALNGTSAALFGSNGPRGMSFDAEGNFYVTDNTNHRVLVFASPLSGAMQASWVLGQGASGTAFSSATAGTDRSTFNQPSDVKIDAAGRVWVADTFNARVAIFEHPLPLSIPTLSSLGPSAIAAGGGAFSLVLNGSGFYDGASVTVNGAAVSARVIDGTRVVAQVSGIASAGAASILVNNANTAVAGASLSIYSRLPLDASADSVLGQPDFVSAAPQALLAAAQLSQPAAIAVAAADGRIFVADSDGNRVLSWPDAAALVNGQAADVVITNCSYGSEDLPLFRPAGLALDAAGDLYVSDAYNRVMRYVAPFGSAMAIPFVIGQNDCTLGAANGGGVVGASGFSSPTALAIDGGGNLYVADSGNNRVLYFAAPLAGGDSASASLGQTTLGGSSTAAGNGMNAPSGVAADAKGHIYVADTGNNRLLEFSLPLATGQTPSRVFGQSDLSGSASSFGASGLSAPAGLAIDVAGALYVADSGNNRVLEFDAPLSLIANNVFGQSDMNAHGSGLGPTSFSAPRALALDPARNLYLADSANNRVLEFDQPFANPAPVASQLSSTTIDVGTSALTIVIEGSGFLPGTVAEVNGSDRPTTVTSDISLTVTLTAGDVANPGMLSITLLTPAPGGGTSTPLTLTVLASGGSSGGSTGSSASGGTSSGTSSGGADGETTGNLPSGGSSSGMGSTSGGGAATGGSNGEGASTGDSSGGATGNLTATVPTNHRGCSAASNNFTAAFFVALALRFRRSRARFRRTLTASR